MLHWAHDTHIRNEHGQLLIGGHADHATQPDYAPDQLLLNAQSSNDTHDVDDW